jgi:ferredoxin
MRCERCVKACRQKAIYFKNGIRLVDYEKCKACLGCVQVCPRNVIVVTSVTKGQVLNVKIEHEHCDMCLKCVNENGEFCPNNLFYVEEIKNGEETKKGIRFKFSEVNKCQGCLKCKLSCHTNAIKPVTFEA